MMEKRTILIGRDSLVDVDVRPDAIVVYCSDPRLRAYHKLLIRQGFGLGKRDEEYVPLPMLGGAAVLAHPQHFVSELEIIRTNLVVMNGHFGASRLILIGHEGCLHMGKFHLQNSGDTDPNRAFEDMQTIHQMYQEKSLFSPCPVRKMFAEFKVDLSIAYMNFPTVGELNYILIA